MNRYNYFNRPYFPEPTHRDQPVVLSVEISIPSPLNRLTRQTASKTHEKVNKEHNNNPQEHHQLDILPPHPPLQTPTPNPKITRPNPQPVSLIDQQIDPLSPLEHSFNILRHDALNVINLLLCVRNCILLPTLGSPIPDHQFLQLPVKVCRSIRRHRRKVCTFWVIFPQKPFLYLN